jgi:hypothetical protein
MPQNVNPAGTKSTNKDLYDCVGPQQGVCITSLTGSNKTPFQNDWDGIWRFRALKVIDEHYNWSLYFPDGVGYQSMWPNQPGGSIYMVGNPGNNPLIPHSLTIPDITYDFPASASQWGPPVLTQADIISSEYNGPYVFSFASEDPEGSWVNCTAYWREPIAYPPYYGMYGPPSYDCNSTLTVAEPRYNKVGVHPFLGIHVADRYYNWTFYYPDGSVSESQYPGDGDGWDAAYDYGNGNWRKSANTALSHSFMLPDMVFD